MTQKQMAWTTLLLTALIYIGFFSLGLPDAALGAAWPKMSSGLGVPVPAAGVLVMILTVGSLISSFSSGFVTRYTHAGVILAVSGLLTGGALFGYGYASSLWVLALLTIPLGLGNGAVDAALNSYVANHRSARTMNWLHCCWGLGAMTSPAVIGWVLASGGSWRWGYWLLGGFQLFLTILFFGTMRLWRESPVHPSVRTENSEETPVRARDLLRKSKTWLSLGVYLVYGGVESSAGLWACMFLITVRDFDAVNAAYFVSAYWGALMGGRFGVGLLAGRFSNRTLVYAGILSALSGAVLICIPFAWTAVCALILMGLGFAPVYPCQMHETPRRFTKEESHMLIGWQVAMGSLGFSMIPAAVGVLAGWFSFEVLGIWLVGGCMLLLGIFHLLNRLTPSGDTLEKRLKSV